MKPRDPAHDHLFERLDALTEQLAALTRRQQKLARARVTVIRELHQLGYSHSDIARPGLGRARVHQLLSRIQKGRP